MNSDARAERAYVDSAGRSAQVVFVNRYFYPDESATSQMLSDIAAQLVERGFRISVICSRQLYDVPTAQLPARETAAGVAIYRVWTSRFGRGNLVGRALDYASFYVTAAWQMWQLVRRGDVIVAKTDPPMLSIVAACVARLKCAVLINWLQDIFPEVATRLGQNPFPGWFDRLLRRIRDWSLSVAHCNIVLGERMREHLIERHIAPTRISIIENWADAAITPTRTDLTRLRNDEKLEGKFVVGYSGNLGRAHEFETLLLAMEALRDIDGIVFLMIGGGNGMQLLRKAVEQRRLAQVRFLPYRPRAQLADSLCAADLHLACLLPSLEGLIVPSKIYGILAAGRPLIFIGDDDGEIARVVRAAACGDVVRTGDGRALADAIVRFQEHAEMRELAGIRARQLFEQRYTLESATLKWSRILQGALSESRATIRAQ